MFIQFTVAETHANVAEICLFHVSVDVFRTTEFVMEPAETQETKYNRQQTSLRKRLT